MTFQFPDGYDDTPEIIIDRLRAELAVVHRDWQADVGTLTAKLQTAESDARRWQAEARRMADLMMSEHMRSLKQSAAARKVAQFARKNMAAMQHVQRAQRERDAARAEVMALSAHMIAHNVELQTICESQKRSGECSNAGMCDSCPRRWMIDALRESNESKTDGPDALRRMIEMFLSGATDLDVLEFDGEKLASDWNADRERLAADRAALERAEADATILRGDLSASLAEEAHLRDALAQARALLADYEAHCQRTPDGDLILHGNDFAALLAALGGAR